MVMEKSFSGGGVHSYGYGRALGRIGQCRGRWRRKRGEGGQGFFFFVGGDSERWSGSGENGGLRVFSICSLLCVCMGFINGKERKTEGKRRLLEYVQGSGDKREKRK